MTRLRVSLSCLLIVASSCTAADDGAGRGRCGDGALDPGEQCDRGDVNSWKADCSPAATLANGSANPEYHPDHPVPGCRQILGRGQGGTGASSVIVTLRDAKDWLKSTERPSVTCTAVDDPCDTSTLPAIFRAASPLLETATAQHTVWRAEGLVDEDLALVEGWLLLHGGGSWSYNHIGRAQQAAFGMQWGLENTGQHSSQDGTFIDFGAPPCAVDADCGEALLESTGAYQGPGRMLTAVCVDGRCAPFDFCDAGGGTSGVDIRWTGVHPSCLAKQVKVAVLDSGVQGDAEELDVLQGAYCLTKLDEDQDECSAAAVACTSNDACCSHRCLHGYCTDDVIKCLKDDPTANGRQPGAGYAGGDAPNGCTEAHEPSWRGPCSAPHPPVKKPGPFGHFGARDTGWHGTAVASIIAARMNDLGIVGVAPGAQIIPVKVTHGNDDTGAVDDMIRGLKWLISSDNPNQDFTVINLSVGFTPSAALDDMIAKVSSPPYNKWVIAGPGNAPLRDPIESGCSDLSLGQHNTECSPGSNPLALSVASVDHHGARGVHNPVGTPFGYCDGRQQGYGPNVYVSAPGQGIVVAYPRALMRKCANGAPCRSAADCRDQGGGACTPDQCPSGACSNDPDRFCNDDSDCARNGICGTPTSCVETCSPEDAGHDCLGFCLRPSARASGIDVFDNHIGNYIRRNICEPAGSAPDGTSRARPRPSKASPSLSSSAFALTTVDGDSFAVPFVAGAAALYKGHHPTSTLADFRAALVASGTPLSCNNGASGIPCASNADCGDAELCAGQPKTCQDHSCVGICGETAEEQVRCFGKAGLLNLERLLGSTPCQ